MISRIIGFDYLRVLAVFSVVWIHGSDTNALVSKMGFVNSYAVPAFIMISIFLLKKKLEIEKNTAKQFVKNSFYRLAIPYFFWTCIYLIARFIKIVLINNHKFDISFYEIFLGGSSYHLWFIPAIFIWHLLVYFLNYCESKKYLSINYSILSLLGFTIGLYFYNIGSFKPGFEKLFLYYMGYVFMALMLYRYKEALKYKYILSGMGALVFFVLSLYADIFVFTIFFNIFMFSYFFALSSNGNSVIFELSKCTFGIYLSHALFIEGIQLLLSRLNININSFTLTMSIIFLSFILSFLLTYCFHRINYLKWTVI